MTGCCPNILTGINHTNTTTKKIHVFVISWVSKHASSIGIAEAIKNHVSRTTIIYSDPDSELSMPTSCETVRVSNDWFWGRKFKASLDLCESDLMLVIQGDVSCQDWGAATARVRQAFELNENIGVYAPLVDYSYFDLSRTLIAKMGDSGLSVVALVDGIVFAISRPVAFRLKQLKYEDNKYGWGILWAAVAYAYSHRLIAVLDEGVTVAHPKSRGYDSTSANQQMIQFLQQLSLEERIQLTFLQAHIKGQETQTRSKERKNSVKRFIRNIWNG